MAKAPNQDKAKNAPENSAPKAATSRFGFRQLAEVNAPDMLSALLVCNQLTAQGVSFNREGLSISSLAGAELFAACEAADSQPITLAELASLLAANGLAITSIRNELPTKERKPRAAKGEGKSPVRATLTEAQKLFGQDARKSLGLPLIGKLGANRGKWEVECERLATLANAKA